jgi:hypothetical protein
MTTTQVEEYPIKKVKVSDLKFDRTNPNQMTDAQEESLKYAIEKFGYLVPIIINEKNEIGDGEHRARVYKKMGIKEIPAYVVPKINKTIERKLLRQTMNKLRGAHELGLDIRELKFLNESDSESLLKLLSVDENSIREMEKLFSATNAHISDDYELLTPNTKEGEGLTEINDVLGTEHKCPKCGYAW